MGASGHIPVTCQSGPWTQLKMTSVLLTKACEGNLGEGASGKVCSFTLGLFPGFGPLGLLSKLKANGYRYDKGTPDQV